jgi:hypothetical protein
MWKMSVQWSLAENDASFRGGSAADDDLFSSGKDNQDKGTQAGSASPAAGTAGRRPG